MMRDERTRPEAWETARQLRHLAGIEWPERPDDDGDFGWWRKIRFFLWLMRGNPRAWLDGYKDRYTIQWRFPSPRSNRLQEQFGKIIGAAAGLTVVTLSPIGPPRPPGYWSVTAATVYVVVAALAALIGYFFGRRFIHTRLHDDGTAITISPERITYPGGVFLRSPHYRPMIWVEGDEAHDLDIARRLLRMNLPTTGDPGFKVVMTVGTFGIGWRTLASIASTDAREEAVRFKALLACLIDLTEPEADIDLILEEFSILSAQPLNRSTAHNGANHMGAERSAADHMKVIDRCIKRRHGRRPADVVDRIEVTDLDAADRLYERMKSQGYRRVDKTPATRLPVTLDVPDFFLTLATVLAANQGISPEAFMAQILAEGLHEASMEFNHQRRQARERSDALAAAVLSNDLDDDIPF